MLYIIPGWEDTGTEEAYVELKKIAEEKGYTVSIVEVDWTKPLSQQKLDASKEDVLFGFSLGAILAWLVAEDHEVSHLVLASMTSHYSFTDSKILPDLYELCGKEFVDDIIENLKIHNKALKQTIVYGDREDEPGDILVADTEHELSKNYLNALSKIL